MIEGENQIIIILLSESLVLLGQHPVVFTNRIVCTHIHHIANREISHYTTVHEFGVFIIDSSEDGRNRHTRTNGCYNFTLIKNNCLTCADISRYTFEGDAEFRKILDVVNRQNNS